jgi:hypothetical protein
MTARDHRFDAVKLFIYPVTVALERSTWQRFIKKPTMSPVVSQVMPWKRAGKTKFCVQKTACSTLAAMTPHPMKITI